MLGKGFCMFPFRSLQLNETVPTICLLLEVSADAVSDACEQAWQVRILSCAVEPAMIFLHVSSLWPLGV